MSVSNVISRMLVYLAPLLAMGTVAAAEPDATGADLPPTAPVAIIGKSPVPYSELLGAANQQLTQQKAEYATHLQQLQIDYERSWHETLDTELEKLIDRHVLNLKAQANKTTPEKLLARLETPAVTDAEMRHFYEEHKEETPEPFEKLEGRIKDYLLKEKSKAVTHDYYTKLRAEYGVEITLEPQRASVAAEGPTLGPSEAPVTLVEFADFQCPYCRKMESVLKQVLQRYPDSVRLVYRNYPLVDIHPQAMQAAQAAMCADQQGKFWVMHDALLSAGADLGIPGLRATANHIGLDSEKFEECVRGQQTNSVIQEDMLAATALAISGTPALFVNGRFVRGAVSLDTLSGLISDELQRRKPSTAQEHLSRAR